MPYVRVEKDKRRKTDQVMKKWIKLRVSEKELDTMHRFASEKGVSLSEWIRIRATSDR